MIDVGGHRLYIECTGSGGPAVILQAGLGASLSSWAGIAPTIAATTTVCAYDRAGHGRSDEAAESQEIRAVAISTGTVETLLEIDGAVDAMAWLADDRIVIAKGDQLEADATSSGLFLADLSSGQVQPMVSGLRLWGSGITGHLAASPDEAWVAFVGATVEDWDGESSDLYVASLDGELLRLTVSGAARRLVWQPR